LDKMIGFRVKTEKLEKLITDHLERNVPKPSLEFEKKLSKSFLEKYRAGELKAREVLDFYKISKIY